MKNSETEREITDLIKNALDNYQEDYIPGAWENFVSIRKRQKRVIVLRIASAIAACLVIGLIGFNYFNSDSYIKPDKALVKNENIQVHKGKDTLSKTEQLTPEKELKHDVLAGNKVSIQKMVGPGSKTIAFSARSNSSNRPLSETGQKALTGIPDFKETNEKSLNSISAGTDSLNALHSLIAGQADSIANKSESKSVKPSEYRSKKESDLFQKFAANDVQIHEKRKIRLGINISPGVNSTQAGSSFNYSGGISTDITLFSDFLLSTGLQLEHQSVVNGSNTGPAAARTKAELVNLDLPLNFTWRFFSDKSKSFYVSGGVSSLAYLSEKYNKTFFTRQIAEVRTMAAGLETVTYKLENLESTIQNTEPSFNSIDIAGRVNIIFGVEQRLSPKLYLHLEPYLKIPVSGLASEKLRFSTGGISCKISF